MHKPLILIVEDESVVALNILQIITGLGYRPLGPVATGSAALEVIGRERVDLVLMDVRLKGGMDGIELADIIARNFGVPVVYVTAYTDTETLERAKLTTPYGYITKSFDERELHSTIEMALYKHQMEQKLRAEEELLHTTLNSIADAVVTVDEKGTIRFLNQSAERLFACTFRSSEKRQFNDIAKFFDSSGRAIVLPGQNDPTIEPRSTQATLLRGDGAIVPIEWNVVRLKSDDVVEEGWVLVFHDVTSRLKAEDARKRLVSLVESSDDAIVSTSLSGEILSWNRGAEKMYGYSRDETIGKQLSLIYSDLLLDEPQRLIRRIIAEEGPIHMETVHRSKSGMPIEVQVNAQRIRDYDQAVPAISVIIRDITARKSLEKRLREMRNREQARIGRDLHDSLGQQLAGILFKTKVLERRLLSAGAAEEAHQVAQLEALLSDALRKTKDIAHGLVSATLQSEGIAYALRQLSTDIETLYGIGVVCRVDSSILGFGQLVDAEIYHIAEEALGNAARHSGCTRITLLLSLTDTELDLSIADDGHGIQVDSEAAGLGLKIMQHRSDLINGNLTISSSRRGTIVECRVPLNRLTATEPAR